MTAQDDADQELQKEKQAGEVAEAGSPASPVASDSHAGETAGRQNLPMHAMDRVRLVMVSSFLVSHVNR